MTKHVLLRDDLTEALASVLSSKLCSEDLPEHLLFSKLTKVPCAFPALRTHGCAHAPGHHAFNTWDAEICRGNLVAFFIAGAQQQHEIGQRHGARPSLDPGSLHVY
jgi:hypothetical protein